MSTISPSLCKRAERVCCTALPGVVVFLNSINTQSTILLAATAWSLRTVGSIVSATEFNSVAETIDPTVLNDQAVAANNIVDWVFIELRNTTTPGNAVQQTRSALLQRDGDIVDIDGVSPIYFKDIDPNNY